MRWSYRYEQRVNRSNAVSIPHTTEATVIFPQVHGVFDRNYNPIDTDGRVSSQQVNEVLEIIDNILKQYLSCVNCFIIILVIGIFVSMLSLMFYNDPYASIYKRNTMIGTFAVGIPMIILLACIRQKRIAQARVICQQTLDMHNQRLASAGVRWALPVDFPLWVELHNDFKNVPGYQATNLIQTPTIVIAQSNPFGAQQVQFPQNQVQFQQPGAQVQFQQNGYPSNYYNPPQQFNQQGGF